MQQHRTASSFTKRHRAIAAGGTIFACLLAVVVAFAMTEERLIHVLPTHVEGEGWMKEERALEQDLSGGAVFTDFTRSNSAFVIVGAGEEEISAAEKPTAIPESGASAEVPGERDSSEHDTPDTGGPSVDVGEETEDAAPVGGMDVAPVPSGGDTTQGSQDPVVGVGDTILGGTLKGMGSLVRGFALSTAYAQEVVEQTPRATEGDAAPSTSFTPTPTPPEGSTGTTTSLTEEGAGPSVTGTPGPEDVRVCTVLGVTCRTIRFGGFDIGSVLSDHAVRGYTLRLSLGARTEGDSFTPDKLLVRYFYRGAWYLAGEVVLDHERSNFDNGGHLAFPLPSLEGWDALRDLAVELEYVRQGTARTDLFLDSVWVDTTYEVDMTEEKVPFPRNILEELAVLEESGRPDLLLADEKRIELKADEEKTEADVVIRTDADVYDGLTSARAYIAVTNQMEDEATFNLKAHIGRQASITRIQERVEDVPQEQVAPIYNEVAYFCEEGWTEDGSWQLADSSTDGDGDGSGEAVDGSTDGDSEGSGEAVDGGTSDDEGNSNVETVNGGTDEDETDSVELADGSTNGRGDGDTETVDAGTSDGAGDSSVEMVHENLNKGENEMGDVETTDGSANESGVDLGTTAPSTTYTCKATGETESCNSFNADETNCIVGNERVSVDETLVYASAWRDVAFTSVSERSSDGGSILSRLFGGAGEVVIAPNLSKVVATDEEFVLMPHETRFFAIDLSFPVQRAGELLIHAVGDDIDETRSVWWRSGFKYRMPVTLLPAAEEGTAGVPLLHELRFDRTVADLFSHAALDGRDVRFYDATERTELPVKELKFTYVDQEARYAVELEDGGSRGTTSLYVYFGNEQVFADGRVPAPALVDTPIEYVGLAEPKDGAVVSLVNEREGNSVALAEGADTESLALGTTRTVLVPDTMARMFARGPFSLALAEDEYRAGVRTVTLALPEDTHTTDMRLSDGRTEYLLERYRLASSSATFGDIEELPIPAVSVYEPFARPDLFENIKYLRELRDPRFHTFREALRDFSLGDQPEFSLQYQSQKNVVSRFLRGLFRDRLAQVGEVRLMHGGVRVEDARFEIIYGAEGQWTIRMIEMPRAIEPGLYTLEISVDELGTVFTDSFDFYWGVLAINTPQSIYLPDDSVEFHMAALDDKGDTICNAELHLTVTDPEGNAEEIGVEPQGTCGPNNVTDDPDYLAWYRPRMVGTYALELTHVNQDGDVVHRVQDAFEVRESVPFTIRRTGATRIWPKATYVMELELTATSDFTGQFIEAVPTNFILTDTGGGESTVWGGAKRIVWDVDLTAGETQTYSYEYDAPDISPYLYLLGPSEVRAESGLPFVEARQWKLASDATAQYAEAISSFTVSSVCNTYATTTLSGVPANAIVEIAVTAANNSANDRSAGVRAVGSSVNRSLPIDRTMGATGDNGYTVHVVADASSRIQACATNNTDVIFYVLGYWTSGTYNELAAVNIDPNTGTTNDNTWNAFNLNNGVGNGHVAEIVLTNFLDTTDYYAGVRPLNSTLNRRVLIHQRQRGGHGSQATMFVTASTTNGTIEGFAQVEGAAAAAIDYNLMGYWSVMPTNLTYVDRFASTTVPSLSTTWQTLALDGYGTNRSHVAEILLGNKSHTASNALGIRSSGSSLSRTQSIHTADSGATTTSLNIRRMHVQTSATASSTIEYYAETPSDAEFYLLGSWGPSNYSPYAPTLYGVPFESEKTGSSTPYFEFSATDPDGTSDIEYQIQWDDDADLDSSPLGSEVSTSTNTYFVNTASTTDTSPFVEGNKVRFTIQSALTTGTTYYWRVRAKDVTGAGDYGEWSDVRSFTYVVNTDPKAWYQTEDVQFEAGTLTGTETYGADAVRISTNPPVGAMVAYGSGASTTPNVRTWNGSAWSASSSALDVGGRISWTVLRAAPTRNEYILGTQDVNGDVNVQVYDGVSGTWGDLFEIGVNASSSDSRAFDIAYRTLSGDAVVAVCEQGRDPHYAIWNGTSWSATSTIDLTFATGCIWASMAASPSSNEVVFLGQAHSSNTGNDFEAQVLTDTLWGNTYVAGANTAGEEMFERMNVAYEGLSGDEAVIALGNGNNNNFVGAVWNTVTQTWTAYTNRGTVNDYEWADFAVDDGSDNLSLCYVDEGAQGQIANWNGTTNTWDTYVAGTFQVDGNLNGDATYHARPMSCQYEITAGRDGYLMIPYTDETNARYRVWTGAGFAAAEQSISTIEEAWTVGSVRTGNGIILTVFRDDVNDRYDFSHWTGGGWSDRTTLDTAMSDDTQPFGEPIALAAKIYQESSGSIVSPIVDFDSVPGRPTWGEILWSTTEPVGTEVTLKVYYATTTAVCNVLVPDTPVTGLPGNSAGFAATSSPINISGLSTSTYNMLCIKATLSSTVGDSPTLDEWTISWERQPYLVQQNFRFYTNVSSYTPTDAWPFGISDLAENASISSSDAPPKPGDVLRLRMSVLDTNVALSPGDKASTLQYAEGDSCSADLVWTDVAPAGSSTALWSGYANTIDTAWYDEAWEGRIAVTVEEGYVDADLANFPVYVDLSDLDATFWSLINTDGGDIRVTEGDGETEVPREVVFASTTTRTGELHFRASAVSSTTDTTYYIYYGNSSASEYATSSTYGAQNVWSNGFAGVWHMNNKPGTTTLVQDSTRGNYTGTKAAGTAAPTQVTSIQGYAQSCDGGDYLNFGDVLDFGSSQGTIEVRYKQNAAGTADGSILYNKENSYEASSGGGHHTYAWQPSWVWYGGAAFTTSVGVWYHGAVTYDKANQTMYRNGAQVYQRAQTGDIGSNAEQLRFCARGGFGGASSFFNGEIDEVRISTTTRSAAWLKATQENATGTLITVAGSEKLGDGSTLLTTLLSTSDTVETYEEENDSVVNPNAISVGNEGEWDWVIKNNAALAGTGYCFRMIGADGLALNEYAQYPQLITNDVPTTPTHETPFDNIGTASTTPFFEFVATDLEGDDIHYEVQVDDDIAFGSPTLDRNSLDHFNEFKNLVTPSDKSPFTSAQRARFTPTSGLTNGTTYWWRVRARDPSGSGTWGAWSSPWSLTVMSVSATTWYQTTFDQFNGDTFDNTEASSTANSVTLASGETAGTVTSPAIYFSWRMLGNAWGELSWSENETYGTLRTSIEYFTGSTWVLIPDSALPGNAAGFASGPVSLLGLDPATYSTIRLVASLQDSSGSPQLNSWTLSWGYAVEQPTLITLFDNEKTGTTTPSFTFYSTDPDADDLVYEVQWSTDNTFTTGTTSRTSDVHAGFVNTASSTDPSPFFDGDTIRFTVQSGDAFTNGTTYWWRARARDPLPGSNVWSVWSPPRSFTIDTSLSVSTWFQTTQEQFETATLSGLEANSSDNVVVTTVVSEAMAVYAENLVQTPRYKLWNGSSWGSEKSAQNIGERMYWVKSAAATTRNEYAIITGGLSGAVKAQIYTGGTQTFGNITSLSVMPNAVRRGLDVAYESDSGDAIAVACYGTDATYSVWNGTSWTATSTVNLAFTQNCEWISLASDPESDEIILIARANPAETPYDFEAQVWSGSSWGNSTLQGSMEAADAENIGMTVGYEESGDTAVFVTSNDINPSFHYRTWTGSWSGTSSVTIADDLETPKFARDDGTEDLVMCYVAQNTQLYYLRWTSGAFVTPATNISTDSNGKDGSHSFDCTFETTTGRNGFIMFPYTDATNDFYRYYDTTLGLQAETALDTIQDSWSVKSVRAGDGNILSVFWDDVNTQYDFSYWNGTGPWSVRESLETNVAALASPAVPVDITPRVYPSITSGSIISDPIVFDDGTGPGWGSASSSDTTPGASTILYQVEWYDDGTDTWSLIPDSVLAGNASGTSANFIDLSGVSYATYDTIRLVANFTCVSGNCPTLHDWTVTWTQGLTVSGTAQEYDLSTNVTTGTVAVAVNGVLQGGTGTIGGGVWSIPNVTFFPGDTVQVWVSGALDGDEAVAVTKVVGAGNITGMKLYEGHLSLGAGMATTTTNAELALYDYSASGNNEDIFFEVDGGNDLTLCAVGGCTYNSMVVLPGYTYRPDSANAGNVTTHDMHVRGTLVADGNTVYVSGSWRNTGTSTMGTSQVIFTATSTSETINSTGSMSASFNTVTLGQTSGSATWTLGSTFDVNGNLTLSYGSLYASTSAITLAGNLALGANGTFIKGAATTTFDGTGISTITDSHTAKQDLGNINVNGTSKTVRLQSAASTTDVTIATGNTFDVTSNNYALDVAGDFRNAGTFSGQNGTLYFTATTTGHVIDPGPSSFANLLFNGVGGNWAFPTTNVTVSRDLTIVNGIVTFPTGILSIGQSLSVTGGQFVHNNGEVRMTSTTIGRTVTPLTSPFYTLNFFGSGGTWSFGQANATTSNDFIVSLGTVTLPSGILYVAGDFENEAGVLIHNDGLVHMHTADAQKTLKLSNSTLNDVLFTGSSIGSSGWYDPAWGYRIPITIATGTVTESLTDFPVYVDLNDLGAHFWSAVDVAGDDVRVTAGDGTTEWPIELVFIATSTRTGELYVKAASIASTSATTFYVYYGNTSASGYASTSPYGAQAVWTNGYAGVWHMRDTQTTAIGDSTRGNYIGIKASGGAAPTQVASPVGYAQSCDGGDYINFGDVLDFGTSFATIETWFKQNAAGGSNANILYNKENAYEASAGGGSHTYAWLPNWNWFGTGFTTSVGVWYHGAVTYDKVNQTMYKNGVQVFQRAQAGDIGSNAEQLRFCARGGFGVAGSFFTGEIDEVRFSTTSRSAAWLKASSDTSSSTGAFFATSTHEAMASRVFTDTNAVISGDVTIESGFVVFPSSIFTLRGSFINAGSFGANSGTVLFATSSTGHTINVGASSFYNVQFNDAAGGWTVTNHATSTNNWTITDASSFVVQTGKSVAVGGTFANSDPAATNWTGSTLHLYSGTSYTVGSKTQATETYGTLSIGANTDVKLWQSSSTAYSVNSSGSLYSQDHAGVDGDLYIWGEYVRTTGTDYWSYGTDFDGADISGSPRQVDVRFASGTSATFTGATLALIGGASATTTLANQGSGTYTLTLSSSTINAQYYDIANTGTQGLALLASTSVTSLADGSFTLGISGGSMLTVSSTTINKNPALEIQRVAFGTSTGVSSGFNVTATGTATSYWWFRNSSGNFDGESYDNDPVAGAGSIRWDDSGYTISVSGTVYTNEGTGVPAFCNGSTQVVRIVVNGGASSTASCAAGTGAYTVGSVTFTGDAVLTAYLDTNGGARAATVSRTPSGNITGFDLYQNRVIVRHEGIDPLTISHLAYFDSDNDTDVPFVASTSTATYVQNAQTALYIWQNKTFAPGGNITLNANASTTPYDGTLRMAATSTFVAAGSETHTIGGSWIVSASSVFTRASSTVTFTATTTGKTIAPSSAFNSVVLNGSGGGWNIASSTTVAQGLTVSAGTATGTANVTIQNGAFSGNGIVAMTGGTVTVQKGGSFGGSSNWAFNSLTLGDGTANTTTKTGSGNVQVAGTLSVAASHVLDAGSINWTLTGTGAVLSVAGTFTANTSTTTFAGTSAMTVPALTYYNLVLAPSAAGSPVYTLSAGSPNAYSLTVGNGTNPVTVQVDTNDPLVTVSDDVTIRASATFQAASANDLRIGGSYLNQGTFAANGGGVVFNSSDTGETVTPGASAFHHVAFNGAGGGWTVAGNATSTGNFSLTAATNFTQTSGTQLTVQGAFTNAVDGGATTWSGSTLYLNSGTTYALNTKTVSGDVYGTLRVGANTDIAMWNSTSTIYTVDASGSLYSQDHNATNGALYIWGDYVRSSGTEHWSYATDFDGTDLATTSSERPVSVYLAANATTTLSGGSLAILGASGATTTIQNQGAGTYAINVTGGTFGAQYYRVRNIRTAGLSFSGSPTITSLSDGDLELAINGGTMMTVAGSVIDANPVKNWQRITFGTSTGVSSGYNVTSSGTSVSSWRFIPGFGVRYGEPYDNDSAPIEDPGYLVWSDSAASVSIQGNVYSDEGSTVSSLCNGSSQVVRIMIQGTSTQATSCAAGTGAYTFSGINYEPGNTITVYLDGTSTRAANVTTDLVSSVYNMHLYENRVIVRHEDTTPITIAHLAVYDSSDDTDVPFTASTSTSPHTLSLPANTKLIVWSGKTFRPGGNITLVSGGSGTAHDGTIELQNSASLVSSSTATEAYSIGGSWLTGSGALFTAGLSTVTFTATTTGKVVSPDTSPFYALTFNGNGGAWTFADRDATTTDNFTITAGSVTLGTSTLAVGGSFVNSATMSAASTSIRFSSAQAESVTFGGYAVGSLAFGGSGVHTMTDTNATSTGSVTISAGSVALPGGTFAVANSFVRSGGSFTHVGTLHLYGSLAAQSVTLGGSSLGSLTVAGSGSWSITDTNATTTGTTTILAGALTAPVGTFAIGRSFVNASTFNANAGTLVFFGTSTGQSITAGSSTLSAVTIQGAGGGWTVTGNATTSNAFRLLSGTAFTLASSTRLEVQGAFQNLMGGTATDWTNSILYLNASGTSYTVNNKTQGGDAYAFLTLGANTDVALWNSSGATTTVHASSSLYSMDHAAQDGDLYVWGEYVTTGNVYWSYAKDFDGTALGVSSRQVDVRIATGSVLSLGSGTLEVVGSVGATTTIAGIASGTYAITKTGGTLNAQYYSVRNLADVGLTISGATTVTSLSYGDFELGVNAGTLLTVAAATIDQNPSKQILGMRFASTSGVATGTNVRLSGSSANYWDFTGHYGGFDGEYEDSDGVDACGSIRWDDSACLELSQAHYRLRADDGGEGAPANEWYDADWTSRKRITVSNPNGVALTNYPLRLQIPYADGMLANYDDLRFTDSSGTTSVPFFIESYTAATATVWVKVPTVAAQANGTVFMYYDNDFAANAESGDDTFTFFDDFEDDNIAEYSGDTTYFDVVADSGAEGAYILKAEASKVGDFTTDGIYQTGTTFGQGSTVRFKQYIDSAYDDEPCTLFAVQSPGSGNDNYAVCLDQYPNDRLILARDVASNDASGVVLASSTVSWSSGWYTVKVDWQTNNTLYVSVYNSANTLVATTSASNSVYTTGGTGFTFWGQHGGWDFVAAYPYAASEPNYSFGVAQQGGGASWLGVQDTPVSIDWNTTFRVRISIENSGTQLLGQQFRLQYAPKTGYGTCAAVPDVTYDDVPNQAGCDVNDVCMVSSPQYTDQSRTTQHLTTASGLTFAAGYMVENPSNQGTSMTVATSTLTEVEYAVQLTANATEDSYCLRATNGGVELDSYGQVAEVTGKFGPVINDWSLNNDEDIVLIEGQTTTIYATGTVSDVNGFEDILYATSTIYRSALGSSCSDNPNNCYQLTSLQCPLLNCAGISCTVSCSFPMQYFAEPTDLGSVYDAQHWEAVVYIVDTTNDEASSTANGVEVLTMRGISLTSGDIAYGDVGLGEDTGSYNITSTLKNTGNVGVDVDLEGTDLTAGASSIPAANQKFATSSFTYSSCVICSALSGSPSTLEVDLEKPTSTSTPVTDDLYWGIYVPTGTAGLAHVGHTTFYAVGD